MAYRLRSKAYEKAVHRYLLATTALHTTLAAMALKASLPVEQQNATPEPLKEFDTVTQDDD